MPSLSFLFNHNHNNKQQQQQQQAELSCCTCGCHYQQQYTSNNISEEPSTIILSPTRWFPRIRRRSSSASSCTSFFDENSTSSANSSRRPSAEYIHEIEDKQIDEFEELYRLAVDEMAYAIESQGSIYYRGDLISTTEAVNNCLDRFQQLMQTLHSDRSHKFQQEWTDILFELRSRLDSLPFDHSE
ncbi:hypothetical protein [Parasitella parasitica]|uniref:Uncharacterized protein n=1 Tax=Parasitella parasitica TaxID=35722 RepID=A0A0B7N1L1_9FUNG|nr:hypothetical protein [Parasitella parasitica]